MDTSIKDYTKALIGLVGAFFIVLAVSYKGCSQGMGISIDSTGISIGIVQPVQIIYVRGKSIYIGPILYDYHSMIPGSVLSGVAGCDCLMRIDSISEFNNSGLHQKKIYLTEL